MCGARPFTPSVQALDKDRNHIDEVQGPEELKNERPSIKALFDSPFLCEAFCHMFRVLVPSLGDNVIRCISTLHSFSSSAFNIV